ncbi:2OG-Fe(II) oxygenase [Aquimarina sp. 2201CG5-10]|uniref:2OG-Fe(II) oxygenase n=1 Tax=Aquimarina callyspongiae TaxID=3098150 RepID=UPI002AB44E04|nr:2OG-Fe(II) oxygenase [Aquimarina sp. 2201CG5-10]MDY8138552.1 2OG-Fe(II) oxygenase [Aquimarina sp. 2201CG5-10]
MNYPNRTEIADLILTSLKDNEDALKKHFTASRDAIGFFYLDNVLPDELANKIFSCFPSKEEVHLKKSIREFKYVAAQMDKYHPLLEEVTYAFQDKRIVEVISNICNYNDIQPDKNLYAGGISMMGKDNYLNPHLDNSHDKDRKLWRVLNLLYYVTPAWEIDHGGNLELWPNGIKDNPITVESRFNRLAVMATHKKSWHSVSKVSVSKIRCCVSNYYFSEKPVDSAKTFHVTTFRGRPDQRFKNRILKIDSSLRMGLRKLFKKGVKENPHVYKKKDND